MKRRDMITTPNVNNLVIVILGMIAANFNNKSDFLLYTPVGFPSHAISDPILYW